MKKVVILSAFLSPFRSGAEACAEEVPLALSDAYDFTIVTARLRKDLPKKDMLNGKIPIVRVGIGNALVDKWLYPFLAPRVVHRLKPDVVHAVLETFAGLALAFCTAPKKILTCQTTNRTFLKSYILGKAHIVTAISNTLVKICKDLGRGNVLLIPNGVKLDAIRNALTKVQTKDPGSVVFVGRLEQMKGIDTLIDAFDRAAKKHDLHLRIVGDGSKREALEKQVRSLCLEDKVTFTGYVQSGEVEQEYARAMVFCGLSRSEAFGNVFLEAQAAGCAVIGTSVGGIPDIIENERSGLLVPPNDAAAAAAAIDKLFTDEKLYERLRESGKNNAQNLDWNQIAARYAELY